jgi:hypothetical protein
LIQARLPDWVFLAAGAAIIVSVMLSANSVLWIISIAALLSGAYCIGWPTPYPVLLWIIGINWLPIAADILSADVAGERLGSSSLGSYRTEAVLISLLAGVVLAIGIRLGARLSRPIPHSPHQSNYAGSSPISLTGAIVLFFSAYPIVFALGVIGYLSPGLQQPAWAFASLKFVFLYLLAATVFQLQRGYEWLMLALAIEFTVGITGFFASYKEPFFIVLIALASVRRMNAKIALSAGLVAVLVIWFSLVWTAIKPEYRAWVSGYTGGQVVLRPFNERMDYLSRRIFSEGLDYEAAYLKLLRRIGYTEYYARILARLETNSIDVPSLYLSAVEHFLMPRLLFPDKPALNDSALTTAFTGDEIDPNTSISVGYVAEAHVDFGFPGMMMPILLIGMMIGAQARYFMTRNAPLIIRQAFCTGCLFAVFGYWMNIDKALGGSVVGFIAMAMALRFGYPLVSNWLADRSSVLQDTEVLTIR